LIIHKKGGDSDDSG